MSDIYRICDCPFPLHQEQLEEIESKAEEMRTSSTYIFTVIVEEGLERLE